MLWNTPSGKQPLPLVWLGCSEEEVEVAVVDVSGAEVGRIGASKEAKDEDEDDDDDELALTMGVTVMIFVVGMIVVEVFVYIDVEVYHSVEVEVDVVMFLFAAAACAPNFLPAKIAIAKETASTMTLKMLQAATLRVHLRRLGPDCDSTM